MSAVNAAPEAMPSTPPASKAAPEVPDADYASALAALEANRGYAEKARDFARRYAGHSREAALATMIARVEAALR